MAVSKSFDTMRSSYSNIVTTVIAILRLLPGGQAHLTMIGRQASELGQAVLYPGQHPLLVLLPANESALAGAHIPATKPHQLYQLFAHCPPALLAGRSNKGKKGRKRQCC